MSPKAWTTLDAVSTPEGRLELRTSGAGFIITIAGRVLMNSSANVSEVALGARAVQALGKVEKPRLLLGGLGMGFTLRAVLDAAPVGAKIRVAELNPVVVRWCEGPLAAATKEAVRDPRVEVRIEDVAKSIVNASAPFDAIIFDLYEGPHAATQDAADPLYGAAALRRTHAALRPGGMFAVWGEQHDPPFETRLRRAGFAVTVERHGRGGRRHVVYFGRR